MQPTPFALLVLLAGLFCKGDQMLRALMLCCLFGASAAIALPALGGAPLTPAVMLLPFLCVRTVSERGLSACLAPLAWPQAGFWLLLLVVWGVFSAAFLPRFFAGDTMLFGTDRTQMGGVRLLPLQPLSTNLTQSAYAIAGLLGFVCVRALLEAPGRTAKLRDAVLLLAALDVAAGVLNLAELHLGIPSLLQHVRNAGYAILVGGEVGGLQRVSGTFPEASAFAAFSLPLLAFTASLWRDGVRPHYSGALSLGLLLLLLMSTSSTAYAGLAIYAALISVGAGLSLLRRGEAPRFGTLSLLLWLLAVGACLLLLLRPDLVARIADFFGVTLVRKLESSSGMERGSWNLQAWYNFVDVYGIGTGLGSARASSYPLVLLSNVGVLGSALFAAFVLRLFLDGRTTELAAPDDAAVARAARRAVLAALIAATISAVVFDLGLAFYAFAAAAAAPSPWREPPLPARRTGARHAAA